ncbi:UNVERIFIED_CONTAM: hypothetical protein FKN15_073506 [Acipenser sinensis]
MSQPANDIGSAGLEVENADMSGCEIAASDIVKLTHDKLSTEEVSASVVCPSCGAVSVYWSILKLAALKLRVHHAVLYCIAGTPCLVLGLYFRIHGLKHVLLCTVNHIFLCTCLWLEMFFVYISGITRNSFEGKKVVELEYEAYIPMAQSEMKKICWDVRRKWPSVKHIAIHHRLGVVPVSEASVIIAISSPHRSESLEAVKYCIDTLKATVPIWKKVFRNVV